VKKIQFNFNGTPVSFVAKKADCILTFYKFTPIGTELAQLINDNINETYLSGLKTGLLENFSISG
jgi:hypothetical protein